MEQCARETTLHEFCTIKVVAKKYTPSLNSAAKAAVRHGSDGLISRKGSESAELSQIRVGKGMLRGHGAVVKQLVKGKPVGVRPLEPERRIDKIILRAVEVLGDRCEAMRWLGNPVRALNFATPISVLGTKQGTKRVEDILGQMENGVW